MILEVPKALIASNSERSDKVCWRSRNQVSANDVKEFGSLINSDCNVAKVKT